MQTDTEAATSHARPPSVAERLWDAVPEGMRGDFLLRAAEGLRRGVHPETTIETLLEERGMTKPAPAPPPPAARPMSRPAAPRPPAPRPASRPPAAAPGKPATQERAAQTRPSTLSSAALQSIRNDPVMAWSDPSSLPGLRNLEETDRERLEATARGLAEARIEELRAAPESARNGWIDPDGWSFGLEDAAAGGPRR